MSEEIYSKGQKYCDVIERKPTGHKKIAGVFGQSTPIGEEREFAILTTKPLRTLTEYELHTKSGKIFRPLVEQDSEPDGKYFLAFAYL